MHVVISSEPWSFRTRNGSTLQRLWAKRRDIILLSVQIFRDGAVRELASGAQGRLVLRLENAFSGPAKLTVANWTKQGSGADTSYVFRIPLNQESINALFSADTKQVTLRAEITFTEGDGWLTPPDLPFDIANDYATGDEVPAPSAEKCGVVDLVAGSAIVATAAVAENSLIFLSRMTPGGTLGEISAEVTAPGEAFTITSTSDEETSSIAWMLINP